MLIYKQKGRISLSCCERLYDARMLYESFLWDYIFSLLRQEYPPNLTSGEMWSHPGGGDNPVPEVNHLWSHRTSTPNNLEKLCLVCVLYLFCTFLDKNEKIYGHIESGTRESHPRVQDLQHPQVDKPRCGLQILDMRMGFLVPPSMCS